MVKKNFFMVDVRMRDKRQDKRVFLSIEFLPNTISEIQRVQVQVQGVVGKYLLPDVAAAMRISVLRFAEYGGIASCTLYYEQRASLG